MAVGTKAATLVGKFFHTFYRREDDTTLNGHISEQGRFTADLGEGYYLVERYEWLTGNASFYGRIVVHLEDIARDRWAIYESDEEMRDAYEYGGAKLRTTANGTHV